MRFAERVDRIPHRCSFFPQIGPDHPLGFVVSDTLVDDHFGTAVSVVALQDIAQKFPQAGLISREEHGKVLAENEAMKHRLEDVEDALRSVNEELDAIDVIKSKGYRPVKRAGRKPATANK